jgi:hypothetical protein
MANYQNVTPVKLASAAVTASYATVYTTPLLTRTYLKNINVCNTTAGALTIYISIVPKSGTAGTDNALYYGYSIAANSTLSWNGVQIMNPADMLQVKGSGTGLTIIASGGEAV